MKLNWFVAVLLMLACESALAVCDSDEHRQFDFWLGEWTVYTADGKVAGQNRITLKHNGCVLHEHYVTERGYEGESFNAFDATRGVWHQTWIDNAGTLLLLEGGVEEGDMLLTGVGVDAEGRAVTHRIRWSRIGTDRVRQLWQSRAASDEEWAVLFDGDYRRRSSDGQASP